ncbi:MAG: response regulator transcription factor [Chitinophagaceae bacterium]
MINRTPGPGIKVGLIDDHLVLRDALAEVLGTFDDCSIVLKAGNGREMINLLAQSTIPDIIVMDINMPLMDGYEASCWIRENYPAIPVIILTMYDSEMALVRLLKTGVKAFLKKDTHPRDLHHAIRSVVQHGYYYPFNALGRLANLLRDPENHYSSQPALLTDNEITFLKFSSTEMTYKEIAQKMYISPRTVDNYRDSLFDKLDVRSRVGLAMYAIKNGIVTF